MSRSDQAARACGARRGEAGGIAHPRRGARCRGFGGHRARLRAPAASLSAPPSATANAKSCPTRGTGSLLNTVSSVRSILRSDRVRISCFLGCGHEYDFFTKEKKRAYVLGGSLPAVALLEDALVATGVAALARWTLLGADALHLEASADGAGAAPAGGLRFRGVGRAWVGCGRPCRGGGHGTGMLGQSSAVIGGISTRT